MPELLTSQHSALLAASAITSGVAQARGYRSVHAQAELPSLGFSTAQARVPALLLPVWTVTGEIGLHLIRPDEPRVVKGKAIKYEVPRRSRMVLDVPPVCRPRLADPTVPLWITEGVRKADAAASVGLCCIDVIGVWNWRGTNEFGGTTALADWESIALNGRVVYLAFDSDVVTKTSVRSALERLSAFVRRRGAKVQIITLPSGPDGAKVGLDDYLAAGHTADGLMALASSAIASVEGPEFGTPDAAGRSQAARLAEVAAGAELFHTPAGEPHATLTVDGHAETHPVRSGGFKGWLRRTYWDSQHQPTSGTALTDAIETLAARAEFGGESRPVAIRLAAHEGRVYLDLANDAWEVVEISAAGWRLVSDPPVRFRRSATMAALPLPVHGGSLDQLSPFVNVEAGDGWTLYVGSLLAAFRPTGPYLVLVLHGEQGSAKSTSARIFRALVDPSRSPLRAEPREAQDLLIAARNSWVVAFDNLSHLQPWLSDALCRLSTGGGLGRRQLYTDSDEVVLDAQRPVILNGITEVATRGDLLDRAIVIEQRTIADTVRRSEAEFWAAFEAVRPQILGALLDAVAAALANEGAVRLDRLPRMADPARWVSAAEPSLGWAPRTFLAAYARNRHDSDALALEASLLAGPLRELAERGAWQGSAATLLSALVEIAGEDVARQRAWPKNAAALTAALKRLAPSLRALGLEWERLPRSGASRPHTVRRIGAGATVTTVTSVTPSTTANDSPPTKEGNDRHGVARTVTLGGAAGDSDDSRDGSVPTLFGNDPAVWPVIPRDTIPDEQVRWTE